MSVNDPHLERPASKELRVLAGCEPRTIPEVPAPDVKALLGGLAAEPWLVAEAKEMAATGEPLSRLAAAGMVARLFYPRDPKQREALLASMVETGMHPVVEAVREYARGLDADAVEDLGHLSSTVSSIASTSCANS